MKMPILFLPLVVIVNFVAVALATAEGAAADDHHLSCSSSTINRNLQVEMEKDDSESSSSTSEESEESLASLLKAKFSSDDNDNHLWDEIQKKLQQGDLIIIKDALPIELANQVYKDLDSIPADKWPLHKNCFADGFCYSHHNLYDWSLFSTEMNRTLALFEHDDTKRLMSTLSGRNCYGNNKYGNITNPIGTASWYMPGDYSLPHTDHIGARTVAFVWHLSTPAPVQWKPEWGGALYWQKDSSIKHSFHHASFNTLVLFSVTSQSSHFVTHVTASEDAAASGAKRLAFNGWWTTDWEPTNNDQIQSRLEEALTQKNPLADKEYHDINEYLNRQRRQLLLSQKQQQQQQADDFVNARTRIEQLTTLYEKVFNQQYPPKSTTGVY